MKLRANQEILALLKDAYVKASMSHPKNRCGCREDAKEEMRLYLDTWVAGPIQRAMNLMLGRDEWREFDEGDCPVCGVYVTLGSDGVWRDAGDWGCWKRYCQAGQHQNPLKPKS